MKTSPYIFISYSTKNQKIAELTRQSFTDNGLSYWMAPYDIPPGSSYGEEINIALENCACFVLLLSNASQDSVFVQKEVERAVSYGKPIFPILLENVALNNSFKFFISNCQFTDMQNFSINNPNFISLLKVLKTLCGIQQGTKTEQQPDKKTVAEKPQQKKITAEKVIKKEIFEIEKGLLKKYNGYDSTVVIPNSVTAIGEKAFEKHPTITTVKIPDCVTTIGKSAFSDCKNLTSIRLPSKLKSISSHTFAYCTKLTNITIPNGVYDIEDGAFALCASLTDINLPRSLNRLGSKIFEGCCELKNVNIPSSVTSIGDSIFKDCNSLNYTNDKNALYFGNDENPYLILIKITNEPSIKNFEVNDNTKFIYDHAFADCDYLKSVKIGKNVIGIGKYAFLNCEKLKDVTIFEGIKTIGDSAFENCTVLKTLTLPGSLSSVGVGMLKNCKKFKLLIFNEKKLKWSFIQPDINDRVYWKVDNIKYVIRCTDGDIGKN